MSKHTPGPWEIGNNMILKVINGSYFSIAEVNDWEDETVPNARLIAAAPELLAALQIVWGKHAVGALTLPSGDLERIEAVIAKAKGEV